MRIRVSSFLLAAFLLPNAVPAFAAEPIAAESITPAVEYVRSRGLLSAYEDGLFHPEQELSRLELVMAIVRDVYAKDINDRCFVNIAPTLYSDYTHLFTDVTRSMAFSKEVCVGMFVGILNGENDGSLHPQKITNLAETAKVVSKAYGIAPFQGLYPDPKVPWHESFWYALAKRNAIPETVKNRGQKLTRGEFSEILYRLRGDRPLFGVKYVPVAVQGSVEIRGLKEVVDGKAISAPIEAKIAVTSAGIELVRHIEERLADRLKRIAATEKLERVLSYSNKRSA